MCSSLLLAMIDSHLWRQVEELEVLDQDGPPSSDETAPLPASAVAESNVAVSPSVPESTPNVDLGDAFEVESTLTEASDVSALVTTQTPPRQIGCMEYEELPTITKLDVARLSFILFHLLRLSFL